MPGPPGGWNRSTVPALRPEVGLGVLGVDAELEGMAAERDVALGDAQRLAGGDPDLGRHEIDAGQHLGHRMLHLDPAVDLDEVGVARGVDEELERARRSRSRPRRRPGSRARPVRASHVGHAPAWAPPRGSSGAVAGRSSRVRPGGRRGRSGRPRPGPRCGGCPRATSRGTASRHRTPRAPRSGRPAARSPARAGSGPSASPCRRRPPTA